MKKQKYFGECNSIKEFPYNTPSPCIPGILDPGKSDDSEEIVCITGNVFNWRECLSPNWIENQKPCWSPCTPGYERTTERTSGKPIQSIVEPNPFYELVADYLKNREITIIPEPKTIPDLFSTPETVTQPTISSGGGPTLPSTAIISQKPGRVSSVISPMQTTSVTSAPVLNFLSPVTSSAPTSVPVSLPITPTTTPTASTISLTTPMAPIAPTTSTTGPSSVPVFTSPEIASMTGIPQFLRQSPTSQPVDTTVAPKSFFGDLTKTSKVGIILVIITLVIATLLIFRKKS